MSLKIVPPRKTPSAPVDEFTLESANEIVSWATDALEAIQEIKGLMNDFETSSGPVCTIENIIDDVLEKLK